MVRGQVLNPDTLGALLQSELVDRPGLQVLILPSGAARSQALITVMDTATRAGVSQLRVIRLEARP